MVDVQEIKDIVKTAGGSLDATALNPVDEDMDDFIDHALDDNGSRMNIV